MRRHRLIGLAMATLAATTGLVATAGPAAASSSIYVDNTGKNYPCSDSGVGDVTRPFCTLNAAAAVTVPGSDVVVTGTYDERLTITRSGTADHPITFWSSDGTLSGPHAAIAIEGQHDVGIEFLTVWNQADVPPIAVSNSTRITLEYPRVSSSRAAGVQLTAVTNSMLKNVRVVQGTSPGISLDAATSGVTVSDATIESPVATSRGAGVLVLGSHNTVTRNTIKGNRTAGVTLGAGATGNAVSANVITLTTTDSVGVDNAGATGTGISNNAVTSSCSAAIRVADGSSAVSVQNNVVRVGATGTCNPDKAIGIGVYGTATSTTTVDYNTVRSGATSRPYAWPTTVASLAEFRSLSGQGAHDLDSPDDAVNIDSANSAAPGFPEADLLGHRPQDNPEVTNSGTGPVGYADRGTTEQVKAPTLNARLSASDRGRTIAVDASGSTPGWAPIASYTFFFNDNTTITQASPVASHTFPQRSEHVPVTVTVTDTSGLQARETKLIQPGDSYVPVPPVRVLDTRERIGVPTTTPIAPGGLVTLQVTDHNGVPATGVTSVTMNVTVTEPTASGFLTAFPHDMWPGGGTTSNLNWVRGQTVPNLVVVQVHDGKVDFSNSSSGTVHVVADLVGYHTDGDGSRYVPASPTRVLDTREAVGRNPVAPGGTLTLQVTGANGVPATGVTAVTMNVTVTQPTANGFLTVYPDGQALPNASNLNWTPGLTAPNLVVVPVVNGKVAFHNTSPGTVHVVADLVGYHTTGTGSVFHAYQPKRVLDTRSRIGTDGTTPVAPNSDLSLNLWSLAEQSGPITGVVLNMTVTEPTANGFLTAYPGTAQQRPNASNLNWVPGQTVPNLVVVPVDSDNQIRLFNTSPGTVHVVADVYGYYTN
ncbi:hypothetical protein Lfu02_27950 [Longispora fulva]|uniref:Parallel beta helix pectate lyase-like protein n=1 Tax=Longispora fulva TaxID=619741 RepID=A0A8J7GWF6_9ACTN|nr:right-handed parallel beta-helix repeat-containing protein [Longispora fulva]MBG6138931.1 hypothetical protein [Longispora fulva]GIG58423.1 hypothetical protein Lfu02_27950 [Longispora fulva]